MAIDPAEFQKFSDAIRSSAVRKSFQADPLRALERAGVDITKIPMEAVDALVDLTPEELDVLAGVDEKIKAAKNAPAPDGGATGYVVF